MERLPEFVAICSGLVYSKLKGMVDNKEINDFTIKRIQVTGDGSIGCDVGIRPIPSIRHIELSMRLEDIFIQDGILKLPDGSGMYERNDDNVSRILMAVSSKTEPGAVIAMSGGDDMK